MAKKRKSLSSSAKEDPPSSSSSKPKPTPPPPESDSDPEDDSSADDENDDHQQPSETSNSDEEEEEEEEENESDSDSDSDSDDEGSKREDIKTLLEPFAKDQLVGILREAAAGNPSLVAGIVKSVESDPIHRKIFVHGLSWDTTSETLASFFAQYGAVEECKVVSDKATGRSKGYGFLLFAKRAGARKALRQPQKRIGGRATWCQLAAAGPGPGSAPGAGQPNVEPAGGAGGGRKLYVGNVGPQVSPERLRAFFARFGEIEDGPLGMDKASGKFRGFALFVYRTAEGLRQALEEPSKVFEGFKLQCSAAVGKNNRGSSSGGGAPAQAVSTAHEALSAANAGMPALPVLNPGAVLMGQNPALGVLNPVLGMGYSPATFAGGVSPALNVRVGTTPTVGINGGFGLQPGVNAMSSTLMGGYGAQGALQGLGAYQSAQLGQPSASGSASRPQHGAGTIGTTPSYFGR